MCVCERVRERDAVLCLGDVQHSLHVRSHTNTHTHTKRHRRTDTQMETKEQKEAAYGNGSWRGVKGSVSPNERRESKGDRRDRRQRLCVLLRENGREGGEKEREGERKKEGCCSRIQRGQEGREDSVWVLGLGEHEIACLCSAAAVGDGKLLQRKEKGGGGGGGGEGNTSFLSFLLFPLGWAEDSLCSYAFTSCFSSTFLPFVGAVREFTPVRGKELPLEKQHKRKREGIDKGERGKRGREGGRTRMKRKEKTPTTT